MVPWRAREEIVCFGDGMEEFLGMECRDSGVRGCGLSPSCVIGEGGRESVGRD